MTKRCPRRRWKLRFTLPSMAMMIVTSIYGVVDGLFISNLVGSNAFAAVNLILPFVMIFGAVGFMFGTGGSALVAKTLGEGATKKANQIFSMLIYVLIAFGVIFTILGIVFLKPIAILLGATPELLGDCVSYGTFLLLTLTAFMLQTTFQTFFVVAEKPNMGLTIFASDSRLPSSLPPLPNSRLIVIMRFILFSSCVWTQKSAPEIHSERTRHLSIGLVIAITDPPMTFSIPLFVSSLVLSTPNAVVTVIPRAYDHLQTNHRVLVFPLPLYALQFYEPALFR